MSPAVKMACKWNLTEALAERRLARERVDPVTPISDGPDLKAAALWYARKGIPVFPVHGIKHGKCTCGHDECRHPGKHPRTEHGFKDASKEPLIISRWWDRWPDANIGMPTGAVSGIMVLDSDPRNGGPVDRPSFVESYGAIPATAEVETGGGGRHYYFKAQTGVRFPPTLGEGVDVKSHGGFIILPPSLHKSGKRYSFDGLSGRRALLNPATPPAWLLGRCARGNPSKEPETANSSKLTTGERNSGLTSLAGVMRRKRFSQGAITDALLKENNVRCNPPLPESEVRRIAQSVSRYQPADEVDTSVVDEPEQIEYRCMADVSPEPICWLIPGKIARGKVSFVAGDPGLGKSQITASFAATVTTGGRWPTETTCAEVGKVIYLSAEDDAGDTIRPRLDAAGANPEKVFIVDAVRVGFAGDGTHRLRGFNLQQDLDKLAKLARKLGDVHLIVIDPITAYMDGVDSHKNAEVRGLLAPLAALAAELGFAVLCVTHLSKAANAKALMRVTGSLAFVAASRAAYLVARDPNDPERRLFAPLKNNIARDRGGFAFRIVEVAFESQLGPIETSKVAWEETAISISADEIVAASDSPGERTAVEEAKEFLRYLLSEGPLPAAEVQRRTIEAGIAPASLRRAQKALKVQKEKQGMKGPWEWSLPPKALEEAEDAQPNLMSTFAEDEHLRGTNGHMKSTRSVNEEFSS